MGDRNVLSVARTNSTETDEEKHIPFENTCKAMSKFFSEKVLIFSSPGIASVVLFTAHATTVLSVVKDEEEDIDFSKLAKTIRKEVSDIPKQKAVYSKRMDYETANFDVSPTVNAFLSAITPKFNHSLSGVLKHNQRIIQQSN